MLLIKTKRWEPAPCPPWHSKVRHKIFWMGHNLLRKYRFNQRTMGFNEQENFPPQYSTSHPLWKQKKSRTKNTSNGNTCQGSFVKGVLCYVCLLLSPLGERDQSPAPAGDGAAGSEKHQAPQGGKRPCSPEGINLPLGSNLPSERRRDLSCNQIRESENTGKFTWCCFGLHKVCCIACLHKTAL